MIGLRSVCLTRKFNFLRKISYDINSESISSLSPLSLSDDLNSVCLIHECRELEQFFDLNFTSQILELDFDSCPHPHEIKEDLRILDQHLKLAQHERRLDMSTIVEVERAVGWPHLWDLALDYGPKCVAGLRNMVRIFAFPPHTSSGCPLCEGENIPRDTLLSHVLNTHPGICISGNEFLSLLLSGDF